VATRATGELTVELLCTAFQSGPIVVRDLSGIEKQSNPPMPLGHFFLAIDIEALCPTRNVRKCWQSTPCTSGRVKSPAGPVGSGRLEKRM
jgi:hypothetical protein